MKAAQRLLAALSLALLASGCAMRGGGDVGNPAPHGGEQCNVYTDPPRLLPGGVEIVGHVRAVCDMAPDEHSLLVGVEKRSGTDFLPVFGIDGKFTAQCDQIPTPGIPVECSHSVVCFKGRYRTTVDVVGVGAGVPFAFSESTSEVQISCDDDLTGE